MKRTNQNAIAAAAPKSSASFEDAEAIRELNDLIEQRRKLDEATNAAPEQIAAAEQELASLRNYMASKEADVVFVDDSKLPGLQKEIAKLSESIDAKELDLRRKKARLDALEARAPELDAKIDLAIGFVRVEANMAAQDIQVELAEELRSKVAEVQMIYAKVRALQRVVPMDRTSDFLLSAYLPDLESCMRVNTGTGYYDAAPNLLAITNDETQAAEAEIAVAMKPITGALIVGRQHRPYVPLAKRPQPYQFRGSNEGPTRGLSGPIGQPGPPPKVIEEQPKFKGYRTDQPYEVKGDQSGRRTREAAAGTELDMGTAIMRAAQSREQ